MRAVRRRRLYLVLGIVLGVSAAAALALTAFEQNLLYFYSPSQLAAGAAPADRAVRVGGLVEQGSVQRQGDGLDVRFVLTDTAQRIPVHYRGILPDLFREGQGIVARGRIGADGEFVADEVLAKHDENYMPPEVASALSAAQGGAPMPSTHTGTAR